MGNGGWNAFRRILAVGGCSHLSQSIHISEILFIQHLFLLILSNEGIEHHLGFASPKLQAKEI